MLIPATQSSFCDHSAIYATTVLYKRNSAILVTTVTVVLIALCMSRTELGSVVPDLKVMTTRTIKWRRSTSEPDEKHSKWYVS